MATINTYPMNNSTILRLNSEKELINTDPEYQRQGGVWTKEKKQLLIDSILNDYDIPKLYFHKLTPTQKRDSGKDFDFAIIDGRQRIETIWEFIDGELELSEDFEYLADTTIQAANMTYLDLAKEYPKIKIRFDSYILPIILVETEDMDLIEDMFSRLNEAVPLNAAEKRNALGGPMAKTIRDIALHTLFSDRVKFGNSRYQHREIAARLLFMESTLTTNNKITDTKKPYLDKMVTDYRDQNLNTQSLETKTKSVLNEMVKVFSSSDNLLRAQSSIPVYYLVFRLGIEKGLTNLLTRNKFQDFYNTLDQNRKLAEADITKANFEYLEFDRLSQQGTNDASNIRERTRILGEFLGVQEKKNAL
jgi:hypothetical protein